LDTDVKQNQKTLKAVKGFIITNTALIMQKGNFYCGTSGILTPIPKRDFPPEFKHCSRLTYCATLLNSTEINSSFYKLPMPATVTKWANTVPDSFRFTFKLWREITHNKGLVFKDEDIFRYMDVVSNAVGRKGCILVQFPPSITVTERAQLSHLLSVLVEANQVQQWNIAVEFRHRSWYNEDIYEMLEQFNAGMVIQDMPASATPLILTAENFVYLRFHGPGGNYRGGYSDELLNEYAYYIREWQEEGKDVYVYFNNTAGDALKNVTSLQQYVKEKD
jgi:uncharacterized protein YecE (DUF72 family)